jgi:hypothetical protein
MNKRDLSVGQRFGRLEIIGDGPRKNGRRTLMVRCDCGTEKVVLPIHVGENTNSCGCLRSELVSKRNKPKHGRSSTTEYTIWAKMKDRCENTKSDNYERYGGRGIRVCQRWSKSFVHFLSDVGPRPSLNQTLDRIDNNGNYEPGNVRWATRSQQQRNRRNNATVTINGAQRMLIDVAKEFSINIETLRRRLRRGMSPEEAVSAPLCRSL